MPAELTRKGKPHYMFGSVTRNSDLWLRPFQVSVLGQADWETGDFVVGRVSGKRNRLYRCETKSGRMANIVRGDLIIGALGERAATLEGVGDWREIGADLEMDALTSAGLFGKSTSLSPLLPDLVRMTYRGHVLRNGIKLNMRNFMRTSPPATFDLPVILIIGTSMSAGKTSSGAVIIRALKYLGLDVVAAKLTGAARYRDTLRFRDAGAMSTFDFVDAGLPSTVCTDDIFKVALDAMLNNIAGAGADVAVIEAGASPLEPYNGHHVIDAVAEQVVLTVLCASDPYAVLGVQRAYGEHLRADLVAGPATNTRAGIQLVEKLSGLPSLNFIDRANYPDLLEMLQDVLSERAA